ncbi:MAG: glutamate synthase subunit alpha, partial [Pseudanabaena sp.]
MNTSQSNQSSQSGTANLIQGPSWLVEERDACGVGFIADKEGRASHKIISNALKALTCMEHRGGCSADQDSGDGAGIMTAIPWALLQKEISEIDPAHTAVGMFFFPQERERTATCREITERIAAQEGLKLLNWRVVPVNPEVLGIQARENQPHIEQAAFIADADHQNTDQIERAIYITRRRIKLEIEKLFPTGGSNFYIASLSNTTIIYK